jgi:hypothetical protein
MKVNLKRIFLLSKEAGLSTDQLHDFLFEWTGLDSLRKLNFNNYTVVIKNLTKIVKSTATAPATATTTAPATATATATGTGKLTPSQWGAIRARQKDLSWSNEQLNKVIERTTGRKNLNDSLSVDDGTKILIAIKKISITKTR